MWHALPIEALVITDENSFLIIALEIIANDSILCLIAQEWNYLILKEVDSLTK